MEKFDKARLKAIASELMIACQDAKATPEEAMLALAMALGNYVGTHKDHEYAFGMAVSQMAMSATGCAKRLGKSFRGLGSHK